MRGSRVAIAGLAGISGAAAIYGVVCACTIPAPGGGGGSFPCQPVSFNPSNPAASGYVKVFSEDFQANGIANINFSTSPASGSGKKFFTHTFFFGDHASEVTAAADGIIINPAAANTGASQLTVAAPAGNALGWTGTVFGGGTYYEATFAFDGPSVNTGVGWPNFWMMAIEHDADNNAAQWPGQAAGYEHFMENDFFEYDVPDATGRWGSALHDWSGLGNNVCPAGYTTGGYCNLDNAGHGTALNNFILCRFSGGSCQTVTWNVTTFHTLGALVVAGDANNGNTGFRRVFFDGIIPTQTNGGNGDVTWSRTTMPSPAALPNSPQVFSIGDSDRAVVQYGSGQNQPFHLKSTAVWQIPGCGTTTTN